MDRHTISSVKASKEAQEKNGMVRLGWRELLVLKGYSWSWVYHHIAKKDSRDPRRSSVTSGFRLVASKPAQGRRGIDGSHISGRYS